MTRTVMLTVLTTCRAIDHCNVVDARGAPYKCARTIFVNDAGQVKYVWDRKSSPLDDLRFMQWYCLEVCK
jgi:hypothetical protein